MDVDKKIEKVLEARYAPDAEEALNSYFKHYNNPEPLLNALSNQIHNPALETIHPLFPKYHIPKKILENNHKVRSYIVHILNELLKKSVEGTLSTEELQDFFITHHENIKWSQNRWLIANPGLGLELLRIPDDLPKQFLFWLKDRFNVQVGDPVIHLHVISNRGRIRLASMGFDVPYDHWHEEYYKDMCASALLIAQSWNECKGLFCDGSWVFSPGNFRLAPDNKPFVSFSHLHDPKLVGHIFDLTKLLSLHRFVVQYNFALRSSRRKLYEEKGMFKVKVFGCFYPVEEMNKNRGHFN